MTLVVFVCRGRTITPSLHIKLTATNYTVLVVQVLLTLLVIHGLSDSVVCDCMALFKDVLPPQIRFLTS